MARTNGGGVCVKPGQAVWHGAGPACVPIQLGLLRLGVMAVVCRQCTPDSAADLGWWARRLLRQYPKRADQHACGKRDRAQSSHAVLGGEQQCKNFHFNLLGFKRNRAATYE